MEKCKHGIDTRFCGHCRPQNPPTGQGAARASNDTFKQRHQKFIADRQRADVAVMDNARPRGSGYVRINTSSRNHHSFHDLGVLTRLVHINGHPFLWAIEKILERAPNVTTIEIIPTKLETIRTGRHMELCRQRAVQLVGGHDLPDIAWAGKENRSPTYERQRAFVIGLQGTQKQRWDELVALDLDIARLTARYFCLQGEDYVPQRVLADERGIPQNGVCIISQKINAVLYYLDPTFDTGESSKQAAGVLERRVARLRSLMADVDMRKRLAEQLGIPILPTNFPLDRLEVYEALLAAHRDGTLEQLAKSHFNPVYAITLRFGLEALEAEFPMQYRTLEEVGKVMGSISRERARQLEARALKILDIQEDE